MAGRDETLSFSIRNFKNSYGKGRYPFCEKFKKPVIMDIRERREKRATLEKQIEEKKSELLQAERSGTDRELITRLYKELKDLQYQFTLTRPNFNDI